MMRVLSDRLLLWLAWMLALLAIYCAGCAFYYTVSAGLNAYRTIDPHYQGMMKTNSIQDTQGERANTKMKGS